MSLSLIEHKCQLHPTLNVERLNEVVDHALSADNWDQSLWVQKTPCGTSYCIAGFASITYGGWKPEFFRRSNGREEASFVTDDNGIFRSICYVAENLLGLTPEESNALFSSLNTSEDVRQIRNRIVSGAYREYDTNDLNWCSCPKKE